MHGRHYVRSETRWNELSALACHAGVFSQKGLCGGGITIKFRLSDERTSSKIQFLLYWIVRVLAVRSGGCLLRFFLGKYAGALH